MNLITLNKDNLEDEHICCSISNNKSDLREQSKKDWMKEQFEHGLTFTKLDQRGKVFIEYIPVEAAFAPIIAPGYMYINCFWVSGKFKGKGHGNDLLESCIKDSKLRGYKGLVILSSTKKKPFLSEPGYLKHKGFKVADRAEPFYELLYYPFNEGADIPKFRQQAKTGHIDAPGLVLYYSNQCPHTSMYVEIIKHTAEGLSLPFKVHKLTTSEEAQASPCPFTTYSLYKDGAFVTNEILTDKKFRDIAAMD